jgi:hypothetical protein
MMLNWKRLLILGAVFFSVSMPAQAGISPIGVAIVHKVEFPPPDFSVYGVRASALWGVHRQVYGLDVGGIGNITDQDFGGIGVSGGFNYNKGTTSILFAQVAGVANLSTAKLRVWGVQVAGIINSARADARVVGVQAAAVNFVPSGTVGFLQAGLYNKAHTIYGFQIGVINFVENLHGIQIGLLNFNRTGLFAIAPILNIGF